MAAGKGISELTALTEVTGSDLFLVTDDTTGNSRKVSWTNIEASISSITLSDNTASAFSVSEGANDYITIATTDSSELITFHQNIQINQTLSLGASGAQFFAFNEDTIKVKYANWYGANDNQYGQGQLWYECFFAAIEESDAGNDGLRRFGFYLYEPNNGSTDSGGTAAAHPTNEAMHIDLQGVYVANDLEVNEDCTVSGKLKSDLTVEPAFISTNAATGGLNFDIVTYTNLFRTANATADWTLNFRGDGSTTFDSLIDTNEMITLTHMVTVGTSEYRNTAVTIDGTSTGVTTNWLGGSAPVEGIVSSVNVYTYTIIKTAATPTYTVFANVTQYG